MEPYYIAFVFFLFNFKPEMVPDLSIIWRWVRPERFCIFSHNGSIVRKLWNFNFSIIWKIYAFAGLILADL